MRQGLAAYHLYLAYCVCKIFCRLLGRLSILAPITGALWRVGREGNDEYNETIGPPAADRKTMGMSCLIQARETDHPVEFKAPPWAYVYKTDADFNNVPACGSDFGHCSNEALAGANKLRRSHKLGTDGTNFWWIELGGEHDSIHDTEMLRDELVKIAYGIWDHIKNRGDHGAENWELEWIGFLPGKRESRRYIGPYVLTQRDIEAGGKFDDIVAYGGWPMDDHNPGGFYAKASEPACCCIRHRRPTGYPTGCFTQKHSQPLLCRAQYQRHTCRDLLHPRHGHLLAARAGDGDGCRYLHSRERYSA